MNFTDKEVTGVCREKRVKRGGFWTYFLVGYSPPGDTKNGLA
jgi:hypothetical protein